MIYKIFVILMKFLEVRGRFTYLYRPNKQPYMKRYIIFKNKYFSLYIHRFLISDHSPLHNHPWASCSFLIKGSYVEHYYEYSPNIKEFVLKSRRRNAGSIQYLPITHIHMIQLDEDLTPAQEDAGPLTLFLAGPHKTMWGFIQKTDTGYTLIKRKFHLND